MSDRTEVDRDLLARANVVGTALDDEGRLLVLVTRKLPLSALAAEDVVPRDLDGIPTDVVEVGQIDAMLAPGDSIGLNGFGTGTLGAIVEDAHGVRYALTNTHVVGTNRAKVGTFVHSPGPADGIGNAFGRLGRFEPVWFDRSNLIDAALVRLPDRPPLTHPSMILTPRVGWRVTKTGRTSGTTSGKIVGRNATVDVGYGEQGVARFVGQLVTSHMLDPGDSGSVLTTVGGFVCGLGFAGSDTISLANPIGTVCDLLGVRT